MKTLFIAIFALSTLTTSAFASVSSVSCSSTPFEDDGSFFILNAQVSSGDAPTSSVTLTAADSTGAEAEILGKYDSTKPNQKHGARKVTVTIANSSDLSQGVYTLQVIEKSIQSISKFPTDEIQLSLIANPTTFVTSATGQTFKGALHLGRTFDTVTSVDVSCEIKKQ